MSENEEFPTHGYPGGEAWRPEPPFLPEDPYAEDPYYPDPYA